MPKTFRKDLIKPGLYYSRSQGMIPVTAAQTRQWQESHERLKADGFKVPVWAEHPSATDQRAFPIKTDDPRRLSDYEQDPLFAGWLDEVKTDSNGHCEIKLTALSDDMAKKLARKGVYVSPQFGGWPESFGGAKDQAELISHVALTHKPVNTDQSKTFTPVQLSQMLVSAAAPAVDGTAPIYRCSLLDDYADALGRMDETDDENTVQMSDDDDPSKRQSKPPFQQGGQTGGQGGQNSPPQHQQQQYQQPGQNQPPAQHQQQPQAPHQQNPASPAPPGTGGLVPPPPMHGMDPITQVRGALQNLGVAVQEGSLIAKHPEALSRILAVLADMLGEQGQAVPDTLNDPSKGDPNKPKGPQDPNNPASMQEEEVTIPMSQNTPTTPDVTQLSQQVATLTQQNVALRKAEFGRNVSDLGGRVKQLLKSGRCNVPTHDKLLRQLSQGPENDNTKGVTVIQFSDKDDSHSAALGMIERDIAIYESNPEGTFWSNEQRTSQLSEVNYSDSQFFSDGSASDDRISELLEAQYPRRQQAALGHSR